MDLQGDLIPIILSNGATLLGFLLLLGGMGVPVPTTLLVLASGALIRQGMLEPDSVLIGLCCVVTGDSLSFAMGWFGNRRLDRHLSSSHLWQRAFHRFQSSGDVAIYLTRWLFTSVAIPTNLLAGGSGYRYDRFLFIDILGEITWISVFGSLGYILGSQWEIVSEYISSLSSLALVVAALLVFLFMGKDEIRLRFQKKTGFSDDRSKDPVDGIDQFVESVVISS